MHRRLLIITLLLALGFPAYAASLSGQGTWESTLQARDLDGNPATIEAWYDTTLNITWLADANASQSTMNWAAANAWATSLSVSGVAGWRLPTVAPINGIIFDTSFSNNATTDNGYAGAQGWIDGTGSPVSEMGHLFYVTLGNLGFCGPDNAAPTSCSSPAGWGLTNEGPFANIADGLYWTGTALNATSSMVFQTGRGDQDFRNSTSDYFAWAVHSGDVGSPVPLPASLWLFGAALMGAVRVTRRCTTD